jgi:AraC-like DNA-binding protein
MSRDTLSDLPRSVRLRGAVFFHMTCRGRWSAEAPAGHEIAAAVVPGADQVMEFHMLARGDAWAAVSGSPPIRLTAGDLVMFPHGDAHILSSAPGLKPLRMEPEWHFAASKALKPIPIAFDGVMVEPGAALPAAEAETVLVCGFLGCDLRPFNPLAVALPRILHLPRARASAWVDQVLDQAVAESRGRRPGGDAVLQSLSEMMFIDAVRRYLESLPEESSGWLAGLRDRFVGCALALLHEKPAEPWTLDELGKQVGLSRSALHERFLHFIGQPPMQYLTSWRMQVASNLLRTTDANVASIALDVGYDSEAAFARAFKRATGKPPAAWRRSSGNS